MDDLTLPDADDFTLPAPPPGFDSWAVAPADEWSAASRAGIPTAYVEYDTGAGSDGPHVIHHFIAQKDS